MALQLPIYLGLSIIATMFSRETLINIAAALKTCGSYNFNYAVPPVVECDLAIFLAIK